MNTFWKKLSASYDAYSLRERWMVAVAVLGGIVLVGMMLFLDPAMKRSRLADQSLLDQRAQLVNFQAQIAALQSPGQDPDIAAQAELAEAKRKFVELGGRFALLETTLVSPQRMSGLLEDLIGRGSGLRTLPVAPVLDKKTTEKASEESKMLDTSAGLFKHGVEIKLEGSYQELAAYLARLEKSPAKLLWSEVLLSADKHPRLILTLTVYTLSLDRTWLIV